MLALRAGDRRPIATYIQMCVRMQCFAGESHSLCESARVSMNIVGWDVHVEWKFVRVL